LTTSKSTLVEFYQRIELDCFMSKNCFSGKRFIRICLYGIGCSTFFFLLDEATNEPRNMIRRAVEREMPAIDDVHFGLRHVVAIGFRLRRSKESSYLPQITNRRGCFSRIQDCLASEATGPCYRPGACY